MTRLPTSKTLLSSSTLLFACFAGACASSPRPEAASATAIRCEAGEKSYLALAGCEEVVGDLHIENSGATDLTELGSLRVVEGTLFISGNAELESLQGLERLHSAREVVIVNNPNLRDLNALDNLEHVERVSIASLKHVAQNLSVSGCPGVSEGDVLPKLTPIETASR